ncbi:MAG: cell surface protein SprA [Candidatus Eisenbacteria bacterium]
MGLDSVRDTAGVRGSFDELRPGADQAYEIIPDIFAFSRFGYKVIRLRQPIPSNSNQILAATYRAVPIDPATGLASSDTIRVGGNIITEAGADSGARVLKLLRVPRSFQGVTTDGFFDTTSTFDLVRELELKNFYNLQGFGIDPQSFELSIQRTQQEPPITAVAVGDTLVPYLEVLGLDNFDERNSTPQRGHDGEVDGAAPNSRQRLFVDYKNGILHFLDPRPFAPRITSPGALPFDLLADAVLFRRARLDDPSNPDRAPNPEAYERLNPLSDVADYYINVEFSAARGGGEITLGRGNLIEGSDVVTVNGERWTRDRDYTIDYDLGRLSLKRQLGPSDQLNVDYSYAPLFQQAGRTLVGSAFRLEGRDKSLGGAFMYESKGAQDLRPRLGEEPSRTVITDLNSDWRFRPAFLTRLADRLPGVRTSTPSELNVQAEVGMSFPNPNTRNEVFIDDMEGVRDAVSLPMTPERWRWSSVPKRATSIVAGRATFAQSFLDLPLQHNAELHWYSPPNVVKERDLRPRLSDAQGAQNPRQVLALSVPRRPSTADLADTLWAGLTYPLDQVGIDLSRSQFIELWVNDFADHHDSGVIPPIDRLRGLNVKLHVDLGVVSEDMMRAPNREPNGFLDSEDKRPRDNQLIVTDTNNEDTGYDGKLSKDESPTAVADLITANPAEDPEGDDFHTTDNNFKEIDPRRYTTTNGVEGNKTVLPVPDTEDLNLNDNLDQQEDYFEYTIPLGDANSPYLVTDVRRDFVLADSSNGWRRYRIPLTDSLRVQFGLPDLTIARHVRVWLEGMEKSDSTGATERRPLLMLGGVEIVGSRWRTAELSKNQSDTLLTTVTLNSVNTVDNADIYVAPFDPGETRNGSQALTRREQSIALEFKRLAPQDTLEAYKTFSLEENYSRYGKLRWYASAFRVPGYDPATGELYYYLRFASDEQGRNYYEVKRRLPKSSEPLSIAWEDIQVELAKLSSFKTELDFPKTDPVLYRALLSEAGDSLVIKGRPSFTRLRRISFGIINASATQTYEEGQLWFDELRATDVAKDVGVANRVLVNGKVANLFDYNVAWNSRDADFLSVGETRGSGNRQTQLAVTSRFDTHRFFEGTGINLPVSYVYNLNSSKPRFTAGDDVFRSGAQQEASETRALSRSLSTNYSRVWSERSNPFLRYTIGGVTGNINRSLTDSRTPVSVSRYESVNGGLGYSSALRSLLRFGLPFSKTAKFYPLPERVYANYNVGTSKNVTLTRATDGSGDLLPTSSLSGRSGRIDMGMDTKPIELFSHHVEASRNLSLEGVRNDKVAGLNLGRVVAWRQSLRSGYTLQRGAWLRPSLNWQSNYSQNNDTQSKDLGVRAIANGQTATMNWDLPFDRFGATTSPAQPPRPVQPDSGAQAVQAKKVAHHLRWQSLVQRLGNVSTDLSITRSTSYSRVTGTPSMLYLVGLAENPGFGDTNGSTEAIFGNTEQRGLDWRTGARTRIPLVYGSVVSARMSFGDRTNVANGVVSRQKEARFPDFELEYGQVAQVLRLSKLLKNPQLRSAFSRSTSQDFQYGRDEKIASASRDDYRPLISVRGGFNNGAQADMRIDHYNSTRQVFQGATATQRDQNTDFNFTLSRSYSQGQKVTFLGKTSTIRSSVNLQLATVYSHRKAGTELASGDIQSPVDDTRLSLNTSGSYGFSNNVTGNMTLGFSENRDNTKKVVRRSVRVEVRAQFTF